MDYYVIRRGGSQCHFPPTLFFHFERLHPETCTAKWVTIYGLISFLVVGAKWPGERGYREVIGRELENGHTQH